MLSHPRLHDEILDLFLRYLHHSLLLGIVHKSGLNTEYQST